MSIENRLIIPFGAARITKGQVGLVDGAVRCSIPHVVIDRDDGSPLRLNSGGLDFGEPPPLHELQTVAEQLDFLCAQFQRHCGLWDKRQRQFLACYFDFIRRTVEANRAPLTASLERFGKLYDYRHWSFSALRPLPRAHLLAPTSDRTPTYSPANMIGVDVAFWTGEQVLAMNVAGTDAVATDDDGRDDRLRHAGAVPVRIPHDFLVPGREDDLAAALPAPVQRFWEGQALPSGPFKGPEFPT